MSNNADKIKLELPSKLRTFSFTFETKWPGSVTVEISLQRPTKRPRLLQVPEHVDLSATEPETPDRLQVMRWQEAQKYKEDALYGMVFNIPAPAAWQLQPEAVY
ncbi:uncharacterized protein F5891DRAFT_1180678 [Suillus fuscotomentosus]|uniref:Uncharacterized protein n=1 Tax=Suillus fuscotomentosus TaxID=1912939 RepID=A0AAD4EMC9_9AGAM|nr:uncharacterized protein F5891DRAFT_1180678 [Suillus fuscotomentosus]KAG1907654.1 hypothetical protein F5891DRAFT_1180678 [Suillus fuscotomentosus]